jgi:glycine cleavage system protein P-like pyridoxal-binding family
MMTQRADRFADRHIGSGPQDIQEMLRVVGFPTLDALIDAAVPPSIRLGKPLTLPTARGEQELLADLKAIMSQNEVRRSFIGMGYYDCFTPPVIQRNILENPGWYTQYTPYQAEISQGRLEVLLNFQTMVTDLTGLEVANASLLDEATAAAEAMAMCHALQGREGRNTFFVSDTCHPQTIAVVQTRALPLGIEVVVGDHFRFSPSENVFGVLLQYPSTDGAILDYEPLIREVHEHKALLTHPVFNTHRTETEMLRYIRKLESRDLSLCTSMIPLGSCTMKLNATAEMFPVSWPTVGKLHPFAPTDQTRGYQTLFRNSRNGWRRSPAWPPSRSNPTPVRRANTPGCWPSAPITSARRGSTAASASFPSRRTAPIRPARSWPG